VSAQTVAALPARNTWAARRAALEAFHAGMPEPKAAPGKEAPGAIDWDLYYYIARCRLNMGDSEFWNCPPRKFFCLLDLWTEANGGKPDGGEILTGDAAAAALDAMGF
jgi:hypothetical protein